MYIMNSTIVAAPGKVLIAGGYLVLDKNYSGLVISVDSFVYSAIQTSCLNNSNSYNDSLTNQPNISYDSNSFNIKVKSFQFTDGFWEYKVIKSITADGGITVDVKQVCPVDSNKNKFIQTVLETSFLIICHKDPESIISMCNSSSTLLIVIGTDNDFNSQRSYFNNTTPKPSSENINDPYNSEPITLDKLMSLPKFNTTNTTLSKVNKTGLGSSAALVSSLTASILLHFGIVSKSSFCSTSQLSNHSSINSHANIDLQLVHNAAQFSHCLAQGKIGSGFDVSCAIFGSHVYNRFSPSSIDAAMSKADIKTINHVVDPNNLAFDSIIKKTSLPHGLHLVLADIDSGSNTPSMVSKVLSWKKSNPSLSFEVWESISEKNNLLCSYFDKLNSLFSLDPIQYNSALDNCSNLPGIKWDSLISNGQLGISVYYQTISVLSSIFEKSREVRSLMKKMGELSGVPIEPDQQTYLINECLLNPGVAMAGVPGAGGFDAIYCIVIGDRNRHLLFSSAVFTRNSSSSSGNSINVSPLTCKQGPANNDGCVLVDENNTRTEILKFHLSQL
ncbi:putative phosphomevalonate kinase [Smittium culicis]|uniref:Phosphomevalonate kinase n=1 Tax=Smittium culicis TaxID=133412 RepID=A0A1R1XUB3_9FUNG|nr:putative phosphomevalonate kinase [Smittium culicis]